MPTTVTSSSGTSYHLWQLPNLCAPEPGFGISYTTIENELCLGYRSSSLLGLNTGVRTFNLTLPTISAYGTSYVDPYGATVTRHEYLRNLFRYNQTTGIPFAYQHPDTSQYYLVDFANNELPMQKVKGATIYNTNVTLKQRRINGETIFDLDDYVFRSSFSPTHVRETTHFDPNWVDTADGYNAFGASGTVTFAANPQNGHNTVRLNGTTGYLSSGFVTAAVYDIIIAMKVRSTTFPGNSGLFANSTVADIIKGTSGGTKWQNPSLSGFRYSLNGTQYAVTDMQAPMDTFGVCHFRATEAAYMNFPNFIAIGKSTASVFGAYDIGEIYVGQGITPISDANEIVEHLVTKWT